jgi:glycine/D-amino acid oxidase-like deaminating enzyme
MSAFAKNDPWGMPPWRLDFSPPKRALPEIADFAIVGAGFTGLTTAAWLRLLAPEKSVVVLEEKHIGAGASGRTGGMVLTESAAGQLQGLGDVLAGLKKIHRKLKIDCDLALPGAWEIARSNGAEKSDNARALKGPSPIHWNDSGDLHVISLVPGGSLDPGKQVEGLARAAIRLGASIAERRKVSEIVWKEVPELHFPEGHLRARKVLLATNALSFEVSGLTHHAHPKLTLAARTAPLSERKLEAIGLASRKSFYTADFPYLWGRLCSDNSIVWGAGLVDPPKSGDLEEVSVRKGRSVEILRKFYHRLRSLHPQLRDVKVTHQWGGPIAFQQNFHPVFAHHPKSRNGLVLGVFAGHGVALSVYLGTWAAEILLEQRNLPHWGRLGRAGRLDF